MTASALPRRPNYFDGQELGAADFLAQRQHLDGLRHLYNSGLHTWGIAQGLDVVAGSDNRSVIIAPGVAIQPSGQEIIVEEAIALATPGLGGQPVNLFILAKPTRTDPSQASLASGYKRLAFVPTPIFAVAGQTVDDEAVFLATIVLADNGEVSQIDLIARRICGYDLGRLEFQGPSTSAIGARIELQVKAGRPTLSMVAPAVTFDGAMELAGSLTVGPQTPRAILDVASGRATLMAVSTQAGAVLTVNQAGAASLGATPPTTTARLTVAGGIALEKGYALRIAGGGALQCLPQTATVQHAIALGGAAGETWAGAGTMAFSETGRIDLYSGAPTTGGVQTLTILPTGDVGVGVAAPAQALVVAGSVQSMKDGFDFGDGVLQNTAAIATTVPVGGIVEWWSGGGKVQMPSQFMVCDGTVVSDPLSKLHGQATPNLLNVSIVGTDDYGMIGQTGGSTTHTHPIKAIPIHTHSITHLHNDNLQYTSDDQTPGDSDTTDSKCSNTDHVHSIWVSLTDCAEPSSLANDAALSGQNTQPASSLPTSVGLTMLIRIR
jgi:hypothetical protein